MATKNSKLVLLKSCSLVTSAIMANLPDDMKSDPEGLDPSVTKSNEMSFRLCRTLYAWLCQSIKDPTTWPTPPEGYPQTDLLHIAAQLTSGVISNIEDKLPLDVATLDPKVVQDSAVAWKLWRTYYTWLCLSLDDATMWGEAPDIDPGTGFSLESLKGLLPDLLKDPIILELVKGAFTGS